MANRCAARFEPSAARVGAEDAHDLGVARRPSTASATGRRVEAPRGRGRTCSCPSRCRSGRDSIRVRLTPRSRTRTGSARASPGAVEPAPQKTSEVLAAARAPAAVGGRGARREPDEAGRVARRASSTPSAQHLAAVELGRQARCRARARSGSPAARLGDQAHGVGGRGRRDDRGARGRRVAQEARALAAAPAGARRPCAIASSAHGLARDQAVADRVDELADDARRRPPRTRARRASR